MTRSTTTLAFLAASLVAGASACGGNRPDAGALASPPVVVASAAPAATACAPGTARHLTKAGMRCVACAPGSTPTCVDGRFVATCGDDGALTKMKDCAARDKRCDRGRCVRRECAPNQLECYDNNVYRCNADGGGRTLEKDCQVEGESRACATVKGTPACRTGCDLHDGSVLGNGECTCHWEDVPFCVTEKLGGCVDYVCIGGRVGGGVEEFPCDRETDDLVVPGSEKPGACAGPGAIGERVVTYEVCRGGKPAPATRVEPCER